MKLATFDAALATQINSFFANDRPVPIRVWAMLDGTIEGRCVVDDPAQPTCALLQEVAEGTTYIGGAVTSEFVAEAIALLRETHEVVVCVWPGDPLAAMLPTTPNYRGTAIDFTDRSAAVDLDRLCAVPDGYQLQRIDHTIVPLLNGYDYYIAMFGSVDYALEHTIGYCLLHGDTVVSEAVAGPLTRGIAELGVDTHEAYQRQGFATITSAWVIRACETLGYRAFWNASQHNVASIALAKRLGFQTARSFDVLAWSPSTAHQPNNDQRSTQL